MCAVNQASQMSGTNICHVFMLLARRSEKRNHKQRVKEFFTRCRRENVKCFDVFSTRLNFKSEKHFGNSQLISHRFVLMLQIEELIEVLLQVFVGI